MLAARVAHPPLHREPDAREHRTERGAIVYAADASANGLIASEDDRLLPRDLDATRRRCDEQRLRAPRLRIPAHAEAEVERIKRRVELVPNHLERVAMQLLACLVLRFERRDERIT